MSDTFVYGDFLSKTPLLISFVCFSLITASSKIPGNFVVCTDLTHATSAVYPYPVSILGFGQNWHPEDSSHTLDVRVLR